MDFIREETPWWKLNNHKRIRGARGSRIGSPRMHLAMGIVAFGVVWHVVGSDMWSAPRLEEPPCAPPPKPAAALSYTKLREMPMLQRRLLEAEPPAHIPRPTVDTVLQHEVEHKR